MAPRPRLPQLLDAESHASLAELVNGKTDDPLTVENSDAYALGLLGLTDANTAAQWYALIRRMTGSHDGRPKKRHGYRNKAITRTDSEDFQTFRDMESAGLVMLGADTGTADLTYHATPAGCRFAGLHPAAIDRATGAQPKPARGSSLDVYA